MKGDVLSVIEATYAVERPLDAWLNGVLAAIRPCVDEGLGVWAALYDASKPDAFAFEHMAQVGMPDEHAQVMQMGASSVTREMVDRTFLTQTCGTLSQLLGKGFLSENPVAAAVRESFGIADAMGINAQDPTLHGCVLGVPMPRVTAASGPVRARWSRVAAHVAAGHRLRVQLAVKAQAVLDGAEAVLAPDGALEHADGEAKSLASRTALRGAAVALDKARTRKSREAEPDRAVDAWKGLVQGRWSLVDHFDRDGRRYLVARRNDPPVDAGALTLRERQVAGFASLGHSNKLIAYEMGLSATTVATHLTNAARKLKVSSRAALIRLLRSPRAA